MNLKKLIPIILLASLQTTPVWSQETDESADSKSALQLLITRASEASSVSQVQNGWFSTLTEAYYYFRFQPLETLKTLPRSKYTKALSVPDNFGVVISEQDIFNAAEEVGATHVIIHTYSIEKEQNNISYYLELFTVKNKKVVMVFDKSFPLEEIDKNLDECSKLIVEKLSIKPSGNAADALKRPILASDPKALMEFGNVLLEMSDKPDEKIAKKLLKISDKNVSFALSTFLTAQVYQALNNCDMAAQLFNQVILRNVLFYPKLYFDAVKNYRKCQSYDNAQRVISHAESKGIVTIELLVEKALIFEKLNRISDAQKIYDKIITEIPDQPDALLFLARQNRKSGSYEKSLEYLDKLINIADAPGPAYLEKGQVLLALKKNDEALKTLQQANVLMPDDPEPYALLGDIYFENKEYPTAASKFIKALEKNQNNLDLLLKTAAAYSNANNLKTALEILIKYKSNFYDTKIVSKEIGLLKFQLKDTTGARELLESCIGIRPSDSRVFLALGDIYLSRGDNEKAIDMYEQAAPLIEDKNKVKIALAYLYIVNKNHAKAESNLREILSKQPDYPLANAYLGEVLQAKGAKQDALNYYLKERELHGDNLKLQQNITQIYFQLNNFSATEKESKKLLTLDASNVIGYHQLTLISLKNKNASEAQRYIEQAEISCKGKIDPGFYREYGKGFAEINSYENAINSYQKFLKNDPRNEETWIELAAIYTQTKKDSIAGVVYTTIYELNPIKNQNYLAKAGHTLYGLGLKKQAYNAYSILIQKEYSDPTVYLNSAQIEFENKNYEKTIALLEKAGAKLASDKDVIMMLAYSYHYIKDHPKTLLYIQKHISNNPKDKKGIEIAALEYENAGNLKSASDMYKMYLSLEKNMDYSYHLATLYEKQNQNSPAISQYQKNIEDYPKDLRNYQRLAELYLETKQYEEAIKMLVKVCSNPSADPIFLKKLADVYFEQNKINQAVGTYEKYLEKNPKDSLVWYKLGSLYYNNKMYDKAIPPLVKASELMPQNSKCYAMVGHSYYLSGKLPDATKTYNDFLKNGFKDSQVYINLGTMEFNNKNYAKTITLFKYVPPEDLADIEITRMLAISHNEMGTSSLAASFIKQLIAKKPNDPDVVELAALTYDKADEIKSAAEMYKTYISLPDKEIKTEKKQEYAFRLATLYEKQKLTSLAISQYTSNIADNPKDIRNYERLGILYFEVKQYPKAIEMLEKAATNPSVDPDLFKKLAQAYQNQKNNSQAAINFEKYLLKRSSDSEAWFELGNIYFNEKAYEKAIKPLDNASALMSNNSTCIAMTGHSYFMLGKYQEASKIYNDFLKKGFKDLDVNMNLATIEFNNKNYPNAINLLKNITGKYSTDPKIVRILAISYIEMGTHSLALTYIKQLIQKNPNDPEALELAALTYEKTGDEKSAVEMFAKYLALPKENVNAEKRQEYAYKLASTYDKSKQTSQAILQYKQNIVDYPKDLRNYERLGDLFADAKQYTDAAQLLEKVVQNPSSEPSNYKKLAQLYEKQNKSALAASTYEKYLEKAQTDSKAWFELGNIYYIQKDYTKAIKPLERASQLMPGNNECLAMTGHSFYALGKSAEAYKYYDELSKKGFKDPQININLAGMEFDKKNFSKTISLLNDLPAKYKLDKNVLRMLSFSYYNDNKFPEALTYIKPLAPESSQDKDLVEITALTYEKIGDIKSASSMYSKYLSFPKTEKRDEYAYHLATLYEKQNEMPRATSQYEKNISDYPNDFRNYEKLIQIHINSKNYNQATKLISKISSKASAPSSLDKNLAEIYLKQGKNDLAASAYEKYLKKEPKDSTAWYELGTIYHTQKEYKKAIQPLESASLLMPSNTACLLKVGESYYKSGYPQKAIEPFKKALTFNSNDIKLLITLSECYESTKDTANLVSILQKQVSLEPKNFDLLNKLGNLFLTTDKTDLAINTLESASQLKPSDVNTHLLLIALYRKTGNKGLFFSHVNNALRYDPKNATLHFEKALYHLDINEIDKAKISLKETVTLNPNNSRAHYYYGKIYKDERNFQAAYNHFILAVKYEPKNTEYLLILAQTAEQIGNISDATRAISDAVKLEPANPAIVQWAGYIAYKAQDMKNAEKFLTDGLKMDKSCSFCNELLGSIYFSKGDYNRAIDLLEKSITSNPNNDSVAVILGDALIYTNQLRRAVIYYEKAFSINPKNDKTLYKLCASKIDLGMAKEAESIMNNNKGTKKTGWVHLAQARVLEATGNLTVAEFSYNAALNALPNNSDACFGLGRIYLEQKKFSKAVESFSMAMVEKPEDVNVFIGMGKGYYGLKNYSAAMELFTDVLKKDPGNYDANMYLGFIYNKNNKHDRAITHLIKALQKEEKNADLQFMLAVEYGMVLRYEESIESFLKAAKYDDSKAMAIYKNVGDLYYYKLKDNKKAKKYYDKYLKSGGNNPKVKTLMESL